MRVAVPALVGALAFAAMSGSALAQSPSAPTPATPGPNPGAAARDAVTSPAKPPGGMGAPLAPAAGAPAATGAPPTAGGRVEYTPPPGGGTGDMREAITHLRDISKGIRENVDYSRVVPDILTQILAKLDKLENKLDKVENALKAGPKKR